MHIFSLVFISYNNNNNNNFVIFYYHKKIESVHFFFQFINRIIQLLTFSKFL